ncbi:MAG: AraC family transcriptional regulator [Lachnospiraceae bacterium]|nr:AraC family transcriptional regulator [Lachnospiraceae bacterium]
MNQTFKKSYHVQNPNLTALSVCNVGFQKCTPGFSWGPGVRNHYLIHYIINGCGIYTKNGAVFTLNAGDCFLMYPNEESMYRADEKKPWEYSWVGFVGADAEPIIKAAGFTPEQPVLRQLQKGDSLNRQIHHIYDARGNTFASSVEMSGRLYTALACLLKNAGLRTAENSYNDYVTAAIDYMQSHYSYPITIQEIADYVGVSRSHLFRAFQQCLHQSPKEYLTSLRIEESCRMLDDTNLSITVIANSLGFDNSLYFSKVFRKEMGCSPTEYMQSRASGNKNRL